MTSVLIFTAGTGMAGKPSNVAQGLANTIRQVRPRKFWLVPSASPNWTTLADIVRASAATGGPFPPWTPAQPRP
jgi:hypothetical protein